MTKTQIFPTRFSHVNKKSPGVTYAEMIIIVAIIVLISSFSFPFLTNYILSNNLILTKSKLLSTVRKAQAYSMSGKDGETWGACITNNVIRLYISDCETPTRSEDFIVSGSVEVVEPFDIIFSSRGEPSSAASVTLRTRIDEKVIEISKVGGINVH